MLDEVLKPAPFFTRDDDVRPQWVVAPAPVPYPDAVAVMESRVAAIQAGEAREMIWLVEHPPLYTAGVSAKPADLIAPERFPVFASGRGGQYTYHGPGQRVAYVMLDLNHRQKDVRALVQALEHWIIGTLWRFNVEGHIRDGRVGVWVERPDRGYEPLTEDKIAAIGIKLRRWVSFHGISLNVEPNLAHFDGIVPCGIREHGVTSLLDLGLPVTMDEVDYALRLSFEAIFGPVEAV
jgi:lipoyl(octanoyl) transferase